jgi:diaminohydroxyphosphoribosylaminopyrimidine deaminase/5-amino-6-(5-phosphoribosylamino)uracil reductase
MARALAQARRASGHTFPNPPVGAVVFRGERVLGVGYTRPPGGPHAEIVALEDARRRHGARATAGASLAVTLEPCNHIGRTGPCTDAILAARIARVLVGHADPNRLAAGGARRLRRAGVRVDVGVLEARCREQHRGFLSVIERGRPFVALKLAASLDGRIATASGESRWITGPRSRAAVHRLRAGSDAVMVGSRTALADDPELSVRAGGRVVHRPVRVLVDSRLRVPLAARLFEPAHAATTWVLCTGAAQPARRRSRAARGARVLVVPERAGHVDLRAALRRLAREGLGELLVEGGGGLAAALLRQSLVDELHWFAAPRLLGGDGRAAIAGLGTRSLARTVILRAARVARVGDDLYLRARVGAGAAGDAGGGDG